MEFEPSNIIVDTNIAFFLVGVPIITGLIFEPGTSSLTCTSNGGPVSSVTWTRDATPLTEGSYKMLGDTTSALYSNILQLEGGRQNIGTYQCQVGNTRGNNSMVVRVEGW